MLATASLLHGGDVFAEVRQDQGGLFSHRQMVEVAHGCRHATV